MRREARGERQEVRDGREKREPKEVKKRREEKESERERDRKREKSTSGGGRYQAPCVDQARRVAVRDLKVGELVCGSEEALLLPNLERLWPHPKTPGC